MKTPQQIIDELPDGNRKRAAVLIMHTASGDAVSGFWAYMDCKDYAKAAAHIEDRVDSHDVAKVLADMIWEG